MKKALTLSSIIAFAIAASAAGVLLYRYFVTDRIMDGGDMTNPFLVQGEVLPLLPENCGLQALSWSQNAMSHSDCFNFHLCGGPDAPALECSFEDETGGRFEPVELGQYDGNTGDTCPPVPISRERWEQAERMLRETSLPEYRSPDPNLSDAVTNRISVEWVKDDGTAGGADFDGTDAIPLLELLKEIAREAAAKE